MDLSFDKEIPSLEEIMSEASPVCFSFLLNHQPLYYLVSARDTCNVLYICMFSSCVPLPLTCEIK